jgi:hypothetical protein
VRHMHAWSNSSRCLFMIEASTVASRGDYFVSSDRRAQIDSSERGKLAWFKTGLFRVTVRTVSVP